MAAGLPCALVASCCPAFPGECLARHILGTEDPAVEATAGDAVRLYPWTIDNKYYTADIHLCVVPDASLVTDELAESVQALVLFFDSTQKSGLDSVSSWLTLAEMWSPEVMILVCDRVCESGVSRQKAQEWCIGHGFELVELSPEELPEEDDDFPESTGVKRIVQALNANVWANARMKHDRSQGFSLLSSLTGVHPPVGASERGRSEQPRASAADGTEAHGDRLGSVNDPQVDSLTDPMLDLDIQELAGLTAARADEDNFERLFSKLKEMKDKAATLPHEQRKLHAEKVATAFWMAIKEDHDEAVSSDEEH